MGICRYFILYGIVNQGPNPEKIMPAQQTLATIPVPVTQNSKGGKVIMVLYNTLYPIHFTY